MKKGINFKKTELTGSRHQIEMHLYKKLLDAKQRNTTVYKRAYRHKSTCESKLMLFRRQR